ncbi:ABC transporter ATP-binding protein [Photobacterium chitinilyticum]|uniref:ATP-binding cassette domain-containing protein n=1 Tax=Photobacterium chitinilyticum TaxID=2485123 RepID=A0A444JI99_9GAMM|nr:ATP-binding cassette domain-containing protein [Photobacterium chitinilyticum]RWX52798.1 ATP-binding cassette domain-containing protein [Photobacterium chitinilyticum]
MTQAVRSVLAISDLGSGLERSERDYLTLTIRQGEHLAISGPSGCGKTSLLQVLAGLRPAVSGSFFWQGRPVDAESLSWWRQQFCYLPQQAVMGAEDIGEVLRIPWRLKAMTSTVPDNKQCQSVLEKLALPHPLSQPVAQLSGGEKQRLAIARAILMARPLWLLDEPTSALDPDSRDKVIALLSEQPLTMVSVSHDPVWLQACQYQHLMEANHG